MSELALSVEHHDLSIDQQMALRTAVTKLEVTDMMPFYLRK